MKRTILFAAVLMASVLAQPALAQRGGGGRGGAFKGDPSQFFARCALNINEGASRKVLLTPPGSVAEMKLLRQLSVSGCLVGEARKKGIPSAALRSGLAQALYLKDQRAPLSRPLGPVSTLDALAAIGDAGLQIAIATCVERAAPSAADGLIRAKAGSPEETANLGALRDPLAKCVPASRELRLTKPLLRGLLAEAMYLDLHDDAKS